MEQIRELLAEGKSNAEVIALGYAPSTVYKVRRYMRLKARQEDRLLPDREPAQNGRPDGESSQEPQERVEGLEALLQEKEAELEALHRQLRETSEGAETRVRDLSAKVDRLEVERDHLKRGVDWKVQQLEGERDRAREDCRAAQARKDRAEKDLQELRRWLYSKTPHWEMEFYHFLHPAVCTTRATVCVSQRQPIACHSRSSARH